MWLLLIGCVFITESDIAGRDLSRVDLDGDGVVGAEDCDDTDPNVFPGQVEFPNQVDDDCDGTVDEGTTIGDDDGDGFCEEEPCSADCGRESCGGDCDDTRASVYPGATEVCDGLKNDCEVEFDETGDRDGDGYSIQQGDPDDRDRTSLPTDITATVASMVCFIARIEPDGFVQGCDGGASAPWCTFEEGPSHEVVLTQPLLVMETEVTRDQWSIYMGQKNWAFSSCGPNCPVTRVSWVEAMEFANRLNAAQGLPSCPEHADPRTCEGWRLPTESEWEFAARGRSSDRYAGGSNASLAGWTEDNAGDTVHAVRGKAVNVHGLYDMTGNVWEWVWDLDQLYSPAPATDPVALEALDPPDAESRGQRGGSGNTPAEFCHATYRSANDPDSAFYADFFDEGDVNPENPFNWHGFRLVRRAP